MSSVVGDVMTSISKTLANVTPLSLPLGAVRNQSSSTSAKLENWSQRIKLAVAYRTLDAYGLNEGICNHLTALAPSRNGDNSEIMLVIPYGLLWSEVTPSNLVGLNVKNEVVEGNGQVETTAVVIHRGVYNARPDVRAVMHTHMPYATALSALKDPTLRMVHQNSTRFLNRIAYDKGYNGLADGVEEGVRLAATLSKNDVMLMGNHGVLTTASSIAVAFDHMYYVERAASIQVLAMSTCAEIDEIKPEVAKLTSEVFWKDMDKYATAHLEAARRKISNIHSEFVS